LQVNKISINKRNGGTPPLHEKEKGGGVEITT